MVTLRQFQAFVDTWCTLTEEQLTLIFISCDKRIKASDACCSTNITARMLNGKQFSIDNVRVLLTVIEMHGDTVYMYFL